MKTYAENREARFNYQIEERYVAGLVLTGAETKSIIDGRINLRGSWCSIENGELWLKGHHISKSSIIDHFSKFEEKRPLKLLLNKKELKHIFKENLNNGITIIPLKIFKFEEKGKIKIEIALARGRKDYDKRQLIKERDIDRYESRTYK